MKKKGKYEDIGFDPVDVYVEGRHEYEEEYRQNCHLSENDWSFFVFHRKQEPIEYKGNRNGYENGEESDDRENIRKYIRSLERPEKYICHEECKESTEKPRCDTPYTRKGYGG